MAGEIRCGEVRRREACPQAPERGRKGWIEGAEKKLTKIYYSCSHNHRLAI